MRSKSYDDEWDFDDGRAFPVYVPAAERRRRAAEARRAMIEEGQTPEPVEVEGRTLSSSPWGKAWCQHIEALSDYASRLPRGRTYARRGAIIHLEIQHGKITAKVQGSELYRVTVTIEPLFEQKWQALVERCAGRIASLLDLISGKIADSVMSIVSHPQDGIFPQSNEIAYKCSCPDWADMCKHVAAVLYGVAHRLDREPQRLFELRGVDAGDLVAMATASAGSMAAAHSDHAISDDELSALFGIELDVSPVNASVPPASNIQSEQVGKRRSNIREKKVKTKATTSAQPKRSSSASPHLKDEAVSESKHSSSKPHSKPESPAKAKPSSSSRSKKKTKKKSAPPHSKRTVKSKT